MERSTDWPPFVSVSSFDHQVKFLVSSGSQMVDNSAAIVVEDLDTFHVTVHSASKRARVNHRSSRLAARNEDVSKTRKTPLSRVCHQPQRVSSSRIQKTSLPKHMQSVWKTVVASLHVLKWRYKEEFPGVLAYGLIDAGADITIICGKLFERVATVAQLKKRNVRKADKTPRTYDRRTFKLDERMDLDSSLKGKTRNTPVYIKMDAADQLLLSEGVCRDLGVVALLS